MPILPVLREDRPTAPTDRRSEPGLRYDPGTGRLVLGTFRVDLAPGVGNRAVLDAYVVLAARCRGDRVAELVAVRQADIEALAQALDLDADDLAAEIEAVLGATRAEAVRLVSRLRESRLIGGITKAATGAVLAGGLLAGAGAVAAAARPAPAVTTVAAPTAPGATAGATTTTTDATAAGGWVAEDEPVIDGPVTEDGTGVGLIPPTTTDANGVVLIPPASIDRDDPAGS